MTARQLSPSIPATAVLEAELSEELRDLLSSLADWLGLDLGLFLGLVVPTVAVIVVGAGMAVWLWRRTSRTPSTSTGSDLFPGQVVTVDHAEGTRGQAFVEGSWWSVRSAGPPLRAGEEVRVRAVDRLVLVVEELAPDTANNEEETS